MYWGDGDISKQDFEEERHTVDIALKMYTANAFSALIVSF